ncbi:hypothetical protein E2I00_018826, partial [Balaenoptera physalus]
IFENGKDTGEISVCIMVDCSTVGYLRVETVYHRCSRFTLFLFLLHFHTPPPHQLLFKIHRRLQGSSINPPGLNFSSIRLFDEHGQEIKNPLSLKNEQKFGSLMVKRTEKGFSLQALMSLAVVWNILEIHAYFDRTHPDEL